MEFNRAQMLHILYHIMFTGKTEAERLLDRAASHPDSPCYILGVGIKSSASKPEHWTIERF